MVLVGEVGCYGWRVSHTLLLLHLMIVSSHCFLNPFFVSKNSSLIMDVFARMIGSRESKKKGYQEKMIKDDHLHQPGGE